MTNGHPDPPPHGAVDNSSHLQQIVKPWGWERHWTAPGLPYMGKVLHINAGSRLSLQVHDQKCETWLLINGRAKVLWDDPQGTLVEHELEPDVGYTCRPGQRHRLIGITDCDIVEVSTPEIGTTWRLEDDFGRPDETPAQRSLERGQDA